MQQGWVLRFATAADFTAVLELASQLARHIEEEAPPLTAAKFEANHVGPRAPMRLLLAMDGDRVVGMISWTLTHELYSGHARVYISDVSVDQAFRGRGVGRAMMAEVEAWARAHGAAKMDWEVWYRNDSAKAFYEGLGASVHAEAIPYTRELKAEAG
jgi:ribosomal protein S18 acetylase RimI-like enzyme